MKLLNTINLSELFSRNVWFFIHPTKIFVNIKSYLANSIVRDYSGYKLQKLNLNSHRKKKKKKKEKGNSKDKLIK